MVATEILQASLDDAWDAAQLAHISLRLQLRLFEKDARKKISGGTLASVSANSRTSAFSQYGPGSVTQTEWVTIWRRLITAFDLAVKEIQCRLGIQGVPADFLVYQQLQVDVQPVTESYIDMTNLLVDTCRVNTGGAMATALTYDVIFLTLAELLADTNLFDRKFAVLVGLNSPDDGQGGTYRYDASSTAADNPPLVVHPTILATTGQTTGAYIRIS